MKKKDAVQKGIDDIVGYEPEMSYAEQQRLLLQKKKDDARPALLKRIGAGLLDFLMAAAAAAGLFTLAYFTIFPSVGYQSATAFMINTYDTCHLYKPGTDGRIGYVTLTQLYDDDKTPEQNYDVPLIEFYSTNLRAVNEDQLQKYTDRKINSGYYYINDQGECVRKGDVQKDTVKIFLEKEYNSAIDYLFKDPEVIHAVNILNYTIPTTILITVSIGCAVFYFGMPLLDYRRRTLGYIILKIIPVTSNELAVPTRSMIALRSFIFVIVDYISLITIGLFLGGTSYSFIPFFLNTVILCLSHSNSGIHDYATRIIVINESGTNALSSMKQMIGESEEEGEKHEYTLSKR